jgi:hydroxymethylbilane synthase
MRIGTRGSDLALWQARHVQRLLSECAGFATELVILESRGDQILDRSLAELGGVGAFTSELEAALQAGEVDIAVHSHKDLPTSSPDALTVAAVPGRGPVRDFLIVRPEAYDPAAEGLPLRQGAHVGTGSLRRRCQALALRSDLVISDLRGNVPTRLAKLARTHHDPWTYDAIILAEAGLVRLGLDVAPLVVHALPVEIMLPAPAQGALAVQVRRADVADPGSRFTLALAALHHLPTARCVTAERLVLAAIPGGCNLPLGCLATLAQDEITLRAVLERDGRGLVHAEAVAAEPAEAATTVLARLLSDAQPPADPTPAKETS